MRGKVSLSLVVEIADGITPAYAGKSRCFFAAGNPIGDHPRLCGEKQSHSVTVFPVIGSPPPMRGKGGKSNGIYDKTMDHPRLCGEKYR